MADTTNQLKKDKYEDFITLRDLLELFLGNWKWFVASVLFALAAAGAYLVITPPVYLSNASVLIKEDKKGNSINNAGIEAFSDMGLFTSNTSIENEVHVFSSPLLMQEVVKRLKLDTRYMVDRDLRRVDLYNTTPISVKTDSVLSSHPLSCTLVLLPGNRFRISNVQIDGQEVVFTHEGKFSQHVETPYGRLMVQPTLFYSAESAEEVIYFTKNTIERVAALYGKQLTADIGDDKSTVITFSFKDEVPQRGVDLLTTLIDVYNESWVLDKNQITLSTSRFISERLQLIETELWNVDDSIYAFKSENLLPDVTAVSGQYLSEIGQTRSKKALLEDQISMAGYLSKQVGDTSGKAPLLLASSGLGESNIESQIEKYNTTLIQRNNLLANSSEKNPLVSELSKTVALMRGAIEKSVRDYVATLRIQLANALIQEKSTNQKIASNPNQAKYLISVERQQKVKEALYLFLLQKKEENELSQAFSAYNTKLIKAPTVQPDAVSPRKPLILLVALVLGCLIPAVVLFMLANMNTMVKNRKDLNILTIPFLGAIPLAEKEQKKRFRTSFRKKKPEKYHVEVLIADKNRNIINEAFRIVRTNIDFMRNREVSGAMMIMTTSMLPGSGKTFISVNMGMSMAVKGGKVLLIDADLRKASLSAVINSPKTGISSYLSGNISNIKEVLVKGNLHPNLDILPVGTIPPNPSELLLTDRFAELILKFKSEYDYIFLDCPPVEIVTDAKILSKYSDLTLFIIRCGLMDKRLLPDVEEIYQSNQFKSLAVILNGQTDEALKYGYRKYGYYGGGG